MSVFDTDARPNFASFFLRLAIIVVTTIALLVLFDNPTYASTAECEAITVEGLPVSCHDYLDPLNPGQLVSGAEYYKCVDTVTCDPQNPALPISDANPVLQRCCVDPFQGSYGGKCFVPADIDRKSLGADLNIGIPLNFKPKNCEGIDEDALSPRGESVYIVLPNAAGSPRSLSDAFYKDPAGNDVKPDVSTSVGGFPVQQESVSIAEHATAWDDKPKYKIYSYYFEEDDGSTNPALRGIRRYFISSSLIWTINDKRVNGVEIRRGPYDPRKTGNDTPVLGNLGCKLGNAFMSPFHKIMGSLEGIMTSQDNLPDVAMLCAKGTPEFADPSLIGFDANDNMTGLDAPDNCHCVDTNSGPGTAAVLMCTRYVAGMADIHAPWRVLVPAPNSSGVGSQRFLGLLFGALNGNTNSIDDFRTRVQSDIDGFFNSPNDDEVRVWMETLKEGGNRTLIPELFLVRFFGVRDADDIDLSPTAQNAFKSNSYVRQFIGCLACANHGGFNSALGCMPMDSVERFLAEGIIGFGITLAAAASIFCIIYGAIQFQLSAGESAKVQKAQKLITQCIVGLLIILFSVFILRFLGVNLLRIYGLG